MQKQGYQLPAEQCENKYKVLKKKYSNFILQQAKSGEGKKEIEFQKELEELFGKHADVAPKFLLTAQMPVSLGDQHSIGTPNANYLRSDATSTLTSSPVQQQQSGNEKRATDFPTAGKQNVKQQGKKKEEKEASNERVETLCRAILEKLNENQQEHKETRSLMERQHAERMERQDRFLELFAKSIDKK
ncbi:hypothetical protein BOX15_Mlig017426g3 [Macrostomum lignano]|nr:hypothetical protein BOX15_Mlig017426g3 [Macrostomum lignano]